MYTLDAKAGRGAIFLPYKDSHGYPRIIESIDTDANTITFKGTVPSNYEPYMTTYGFAIYLGLAVNMQVQHPDADSNRPVTCLSIPPFLKNAS